MPIPFYHAIADSPPAHLKHLKALRSFDDFEHDIQALQDAFSPVQAVDAENSDITNQGRFCVSFDDGLCECATLISAMLRRAGVPAIFFVTPAVLDNKAMLPEHRASLLAERIIQSGRAPEEQSGGTTERQDSNDQQTNRPTDQDTRHEAQRTKHWEQVLFPPLSTTHDPRSTVTPDGFELARHIRELPEEKVRELCREYGVDVDEYLRTEQPYLTSDQVRSLIADGFWIGAHSCSHRNFAALSRDEQLQETRESVNFLKEKFGLDYGLFAFPFLRVPEDPRYWEEMKKSGEVDLFFGQHGLPVDRKAPFIPRISMEGENATKPIKQILKEERDKARRRKRKLWKRRLRGLLPF